MLQAGQIKFATAPFLFCPILGGEKEEKMMTLTREEIQRIKEEYPTGTRIRLIYMNDSRPVPPNTLGTVTHVDDIGTIRVNWDNRSTLGRIMHSDIFVKVRPSMDDFFVLTSTKDLFHIMR